MKKSILCLLSALLFFVNINSQEKKEKVATSEKKTKNAEGKELDWDHYFIRYHPVKKISGKEVFKKSERTWYFLSPLEHLEADKGVVKVYGFIPERRHGISEKLYEEIYKGFKTPENDNIKPKAYNYSIRQPIIHNQMIQNQLN